MAVREPPDASAIRADALIALALGMLGCVMVALSNTVGVLSKPDVPVMLTMLGALAIATPLMFRRIFPVPTALAQTAIFIAFGELATVELYASQIALFFGIYSVGAWEARRRRANLTRLSIVLVMFVWFATGMVRALIDPVSGERSVAELFAILGINLISNVLFYWGAWVFGDRAWARAVNDEELARAHDEIRAQQEQLTEQAVALERVRIARELHDVVAHHVSAMGVQAGAARRVLDWDSKAAKDALQHVERSAREAISELRSLVLTLRSEESDTGVAPDLSGIDALVQTAALTDQQVQLTRIGEPTPLSPAVELTAYRVIQEALTNARKHAGAAALVDVRVRFTPSALEVEVADNGHGGPAALRGSGLGLVGLRERVLAIGGTLEAGPKQRGGFLVRAALPAVPTVGGGAANESAESGQRCGVLMPEAQSRRTGPTRAASA